MVGHVHALVSPCDGVAVPVFLRKGANLLQYGPTCEVEIAFAIGLIAVHFDRFDCAVLYEGICKVVKLDVSANILIGSRTDPAALFAIPHLVWIVEG